MIQEWTIGGEHNGWRLDKFLVLQLPDRSRSQLQKQIVAGDALVNGKPVTKHHFLETGDTVSLAEKKPEVREVQKPVEIPILHEDESIIVIDKPAGVLVHPVPQRAQWTVVDFLLTNYPEIDGVGEEKERPGIVHRLDRDASGVMVIAKTDAAYFSLKQQFMERTVEKHYQAIVHGVPINESDVIKFKIAHSATKGGKMAARPEHAEGREAWTEYNVLATKKKRYALLEVSIKTGRTHQIRAHMAAIDHPIVGDAVYTSKRYLSKKSYSRMFLHSWKLGIAHPASTERVIYTAPIPGNFEQFMG